MYTLVGTIHLILAFLAFLYIATIQTVLVDESCCSRLSRCCGPSSPSIYHSPWRLLYSFILTTMSLCSVCEALDLGARRTRVRSHKDQSLGEYNELLSRADSGCEACGFFCTILQSSGNWKGRESELSGRIIFFSSLRLDARKPKHIGRSTWSCDDLLFDLCTPEDYTGE